jgi:hypothetical protein
MGRGQKKTRYTNLDLHYCLNLCLSTSIEFKKALECQWW